MDNKKPSSIGQNGRRKSGGGSTHLRSPVVKRPSSAPVSLQGWLHKQGSEGLMLWKKRWFVLSEYCLFYYKGPEEEKLLGSILLPSYKVSPCTAEDKVYRKFAFKAEHANMRTYYFAAETRELMTRWMNALSLATILQEGEKLQNQVQPSVTIPSVLTQNSDSSNSDFKGYLSNSVPITMQPTSQNRNLEKNNEVNGWMPQRLGNSYQPLYANAPPKPKRLNNEGQYGSSPEASPTLLDDAENAMYGNRKQFRQTVSPNRGEEYLYHPYKPKISPGPDIVRSMPYSGNSSGEKTPERLGKIDVNYSNFSRRPRGQDGEGYNYSDFIKSDNYNNMLQRPNEQNLFDNEKALNQLVNYQHPKQFYQSYRTAPQMSSTVFQNYENNRSNSSKRGLQPPRPHSADFLDYDTKKCYLSKENKALPVSQKSSSKMDSYNSRPPRPKSSLDITHANDGYYWSEERYAEKMRQSAIYLQNTLPQRSQSSRANTPNLKQVSENRTTVDYKNVKSEEMPAVVKQRISRDVKKPTPVTQDLRRWSEHQERMDNYFVRSASARLPKQRTLDDESDEIQAYTGGEDFDENRKEDSMKRLLEWKQRMLQSPLTRKPSESSTRGIAQNELSKSYKLQLLKELERQEMEGRGELGKKRVKSDGKRLSSRTTDGRRSALFASDRYYSNSSDDEENESTSDKRPRRATQIGKPRKGSEEPKEKKMTPNSSKTLSYVSPDYENVVQTLTVGGGSYNENKNEESLLDESNLISSGKEVRFSKPDIKIKRSGQDAGIKTSPESRNNCYEILRETTETSVPKVSDLSANKTKNFGLGEPFQNSPSKKANWNEKIDETKLIKEYSYQYIKEAETSKSSSNNFKVYDAPPENIVKSRIKQLGLNGQIETESRDITMKEPLKISSPVYHLNEAHVSNLKSADNNTYEKEKDVNLFISGNAQQNPPKTAVKNVPEKHQKSVRDLLADFERKSQLFQEKEALEQEKSFNEVPGKRYVFSDTETLLYDSSSDTEKKKEKPDPGLLNNLKKPESRREMSDDEEDGDEEVAAALGRREQFFSSCRDLGRKRDSDISGNKGLAKQAGIEPSPSSEVESIMTPGYLCSSLTELVAALENSDSTCSTPTIDKVKDNLKKTLPADSFSKAAEETLIETKEETCEGHYMPMTPSRRVSAPSSDKSRSNSSLHSFLMGVEETYVEMAENSFSNYPESNKSPVSKVRKAYLDQDSPGYCEITNNPESHYDFLYRSTSMREPEYMEVNTLLEILKEQDEKIKEHKDAVKDTSKRQCDKIAQEAVPPTPPRSALPDILNSSSAGQKIVKSDSSDADDESSKDLDSLDIPRHPRFSLSDTFRPASYYLGSTINERKRNLIKLPNPSENHDSSDSDLVSPPPIPTSPLLLDDLDTSLETEKSIELKPNISKIKLEKGVNKKIWSETTQDLEYEADAKKKKRRPVCPVSEEVLETLEKSEQSLGGKSLVFNELDAIGSRNGLAFDDESGDINLDKYLEELQLSGNINAHLYSKDFSESIYKSCEKEIHKNLMPKDNISKTDSNEKALLKGKNPTESFNNEESSEPRKTGEEVQYENLQALFPPPPPELYDSGNDHSDRESALASYSNVSFPEVPPPDNYCDVYEPEGTENPKVCFHPVTLQEQNGSESLINKPATFENQGAPYYYSDIIKNDEEDINGLTPDRTLSGVRGYLGGYRLQTLNNQRGDLQEASQITKRNDIGRKVNPISENYLVENPASDLDEVQKIAAELRTTSAHFMGAADKSGSVDIRNIYESDTLQRRKTGGLEEVRARTPDLHHSKGVARNLYPHGLKDKTMGTSLAASYSTEDEFSSLQSRSRSRSLEGLLNRVELPSDINTRPRPVNQTSNDLRTQNDSTSQKVQTNHTRIHSCEGDEPWEKDALWRENLRKASLRHTRSLDNLDDESSSTNRRLNLPSYGRITEAFDSGRKDLESSANSSVTGRRSADHFYYHPKPKLSREVTYVNDAFRKNRQLDLAREYEQDYREGRPRLRKRESEIQTVIELSDSDVRDCDDGVHYEKLIRNRVNLERHQSRNYPEGMEKKEEKRESKRNDQAGVSTNLKPVESLREPQSKPQLNPSQGTALKPIDREKLRQWDLMSSGMVDQEIVQKKTDGQDTKGKTQGSNEKTSPHKTETVTSKGQRGGTKSQLQDPAHCLEASGSGSAAREPGLSAPNSVNPEQNQKSPTEAPLVFSMASKAENFLDGKTEIPSIDRNLNEFTERIDYYDRGKQYLPILNGYGEWSEVYSDRKNNSKADETVLVSEYPGKGRVDPENEYYFSQYSEKKYSPEYGKAGFSLLIPKNEVSSTTLPSSPLGRTPEGRYTGKENSVKRKMSSSPWGLDVSAGELLGRTHEELVLLLIQLRRQSASICKAMEACHIEIEEQARMAALDTPTRLEHIRKLEKLKKHLLELEKQYEKGKPLVNLVDNMVKLGSLYKGNHHVYNSSLGLDYNPDVRERLEFNQKVQEQRLLAEERKDWDRLSPDHGQLQAKVQQLYRLDRLLQEESGTLHNLQQDKELLEKALGGLRHKLQISRSNPIEADRYRKQQKLLEKELSRVRLLLAHNSKKLEETVAENARLEQELVILRQKLQASRVSSRNSVPLLPESTTWSTTAALEAELRRVQQLVGDLQRQRHELSAQVKQLTEKSDTLVQQIRPGPTGVAGAGPIPGKKKSSSTWLETDLDLLVTQDVSVENSVTSPQQQTPIILPGSRSTTPIYINTDTSKKDISSHSEELKSPSKNPSSEEIQIKTYCTPVELSEADERMKRFYGIIPKEKQEIKTVRIVKRESERRQRDRDRNGNIGIPVGSTAVAKRVSVIEENDDYGLERVDEESYESTRYSPNFNEQAGDSQDQEYSSRDGKSDCYVNFHPTNPFLPQNLQQNGEEISVAHQNLTTSPDQRSLSLPRGFGKNYFPEQGFKNEETSESKSLGSRRNRVRFENQYENGTKNETGLNTHQNENFKNHGYPGEVEYSLSRVHLKNFNFSQKLHGTSESMSPTQMTRNLKLDSEARGHELKEKRPDSLKPLTAKEQLFASNYYPQGESSPQLSPVYQSEAAREIIMEMSNSSVQKNPNRRQIRKEKRRHHTVSNIRHVLEGNDQLKMGSARSRDDLDMERALRPRINAPDVVRSTMSQKDLKYNESTIDSILGTPNKIVIPERYIPEHEQLTAEEQLQRLRKAESIRKMLSETTALSTPDLSAEGTEEEKKSCTLRKKVEEEKKQREHLLELNQILAQQVMEKSKLVAGSVTASLHQQD